jgi:hypothetical protein
MHSAQHHIQARFAGLFHGRPDPEWLVGDGWLRLVEFALEKIQQAAGTDVDQVFISHIREFKGELVIQASYPPELRAIDDVLDRARESSCDLCLSCGGYAATSLLRPLCRACVD